MISYSSAEMMAIGPIKKMPTIRRLFKKKNIMIWYYCYEADFYCVPSPVVLELHFHASSTMFHRILYTDDTGTSSPEPTIINQSREFP